MEISFCLCGQKLLLEYDNSENLHNSTVRLRLCVREFAHLLGVYYLHFSSHLPRENQLLFLGEK